MSEHKTVEKLITVDGPSGVGKGTICLLLSHKLGWPVLDSGALYRLTACAAMDDGTAEDDYVGLEETALNLDVRFQSGAEGLRYFLRDQDVSDKIREEQTGNMASKVAAVEGVRAALLEKQRSLANQAGLIADGRDMGTVVFPNAPLKIYLTASPEERAERRFKQLKEKGIDVNIRDLVADLTARDERDSNRKVAPLKPAEDAVIIDTTALSVAEVEAKVLDLAQRCFS
ncbi:MAG: (d)CMP kinase [Gammaproteobacteria bacterium]|nr:(d)CMP kinase [Gammaproteobacteria bacterium]